MLDNTKDSYKVKPIHVNDFTKILKIKVVFTFKEKKCCFISFSSYPERCKLFFMFMQV